MPTTQSPTAWVTTGYLRHRIRVAALLTATALVSVSEWAASALL